MKELVHTQWEVGFWSNLRDQEGLDAVLAALDPLVLYNLDFVRAAMEAAFLARDEAMAGHIYKHWAGLFNPNETEIKSSWPCREILYYLRGKTDPQWLDMLWSANANTTTQKDKSLLCEALDEIKKQLEFGDLDGIPRLISLIPRLLQQGARASDGHPTAYHRALDISGALKIISPAPALNQYEAWELLLDVMRQDELAKEQYDKLEEQMAWAIQTSDMSSISSLANEYREIPVQCQKKNPVSLCIRRLAENKDFPAPEVFRALFSNGLDPKGYGPTGEPPLYAILNDNDIAPATIRKVVSVLIECGCDPSQPHMQKFQHHGTTHDTPLHACTLMSESPFDLLVDAGANVDAKDYNGMTPLLYACRENQLAMMTGLLDAGADPHIRGSEGLNAAHEVLSCCLSDLMIESQSTENIVQAVNLLTKFGVDFMTGDHLDRSPWQMFCHSVHSAVEDDKVHHILVRLDEQGLSLPWGHIDESLASAPFLGKAKAYSESHVLNLGTSISYGARMTRRI